MNTQTFVEFEIETGAMYTLQERKKVESRDVTIKKLPEDCVAFRFYDEEEGKYVNKTGTFYVGGKILNADQVLKLGNQEVLYGNMVRNNISLVVRVGKSFFEFHKERDRLV